MVESRIRQPFVTFWRCILDSRPSLNTCLLNRRSPSILFLISKTGPFCTRMEFWRGTSTALCYTNEIVSLASIEAATIGQNPKIRSKLRTWSINRRIWQTLDTVLHQAEPNINGELRSAAGQRSLGPLPLADMRVTLLTAEQYAR